MHVVSSVTYLGPRGNVVFASQRECTIRTDAIEGIAENMNYVYPDAVYEGHPAAIFLVKRLG